MSKPFLTLIAILFLAGCGGDASVPNQFPDDIDSVLMNADVITLYSLDPSETYRLRLANENWTDPIDTDSFHSWVVLGHVKIDDQEHINTIVSSLQRDLNNYSTYDGVLPPCKFQPRHAIRAESAKEVVDIAICFQCMQVMSFVDEIEVDFRYTMASSKQLYNGVLSDNLVPLAAD